MVEIFARCSQCRVPRFQPLQMDKSYDLLTVSYLVDGGDGHRALKNKNTRHLKGLDITFVRLKVFF